MLIRACVANIIDSIFSGTENILCMLTFYNNNNNNNELYNAEAALKVQWIEIPMAMDTHIHTN